MYYLCWNMMKSLKRAFLLFTLLSPSVLAGEIALSFDDAPTPDSEVMNGSARTASLLRELRNADVNEVLFL